jgi:RNA polymerase sigma-70 factor (ECF subfamily)
VVDETFELSSLGDLDPKAITKAHDRYFPELYRYAMFRTGNGQISEDIASEAFKRLLEALQKGAGPRTSLRGWLFGTTSHLIDDHFRKLYKHPTEALSTALPSQNADPFLLAEKEADLQAIRLATSKLTADQRKVLALRFGSQMSLKETAEVMGKLPNAIKALQFRALRALRRHLGDDMP